MRSWHAVAYGMWAVVLASCARSQRVPATGIDVAGREVGVLGWTSGIRGRDGGYSALWHDHSLWTFGDTMLAGPAEDGETWRSSTWCWSRDRDTADGLACSEPVDAAGMPRELLSFSAAESAFNKSHFGPMAANCKTECGTRYALWPAAMVVSPSSGALMIFYSRLVARPGPFNFHRQYTGLAIWDSPERPVRRDARALFTADEPSFGAAAVTVGSDVIAYACDCKGMDCPCVIGRAPAARATERGAWSFWDGEGWQRHIDARRAVMSAAPQLSVHFNHYLGVWLAFYNAPLSSRFEMRTAPAPEGPWSSPQLVFNTRPPASPGAWTYCGLGHPELARGGGRFEIVSYFRDTGFLAGEIRLVELTFDRGG